MRNILHVFVTVNFLHFTLATIVGERRFVPRANQVHLGSAASARRWVYWCYQDQDCGLGFCRAYDCQCPPGYITWYFLEPCAYEQRRKLTAFLVSFFTGIFGVDWFVLSRGQAGYIVAGIIKSIITLGCFIGCYVVLTGDKRKSRKNTNMAMIITVVLAAMTLVWWLIDWIRVLADVFYDGRGAPLMPWGYYYGYDRIPYRV